MAASGRILFVGEKFPHPLDDGGQIRTYHVLRALAAEFPTTLISLDAPSAEDERAIRDLGVEVVPCGPRRASWTVPWFAAQALFTRAPYPMRKNFSRAILAEIRRRLAAGSVRALHLNHLDAAQYVEHLGPARAGVRVVFDTHNLLTQLYERMAASAPDPIRRAYTIVQWWRMSRFEPAILRAVDRALVCSDLERERLRVWGVDRALVVPNGVDVERFSPEGRRPSAEGAPARIVFVGALSYAPNREAVRWLLDGILPELRAILPRFELTVVGKGAPGRLFARARPGEVEIAGRVDDVRPFLARADVCAVPMKAGGGTRIKILDSMAAGTPVVSTRVGAEGIDARDGESIVLADEAAAFARAIADLARSPERARSIAAAARRLVEERYAWPRVLAPLVDGYRGD